MRLNNTSPRCVGYPVIRQRMKLIGARKDVSSLEKVNSVITKVVENPLCLVCDWQSFLGNQLGMGLINWDQLDVDENDLNGCVCSITPWVACPVHPCLCNTCKAADGRRSKADCIWRKSAANFMEKHCDEMIQQELKQPQMSYLQLADLQGVDTPKQARVRHLLNVIARLPEIQPIHASLALVDLTQSLDRRPFRVDGCCLPIATNTVLWSMKLGKLLTIKQSAELMGHQMEDGGPNFEGIPKSVQQRLIGNSIHVAVIGSLLIAVIAMACPTTSS